MNRRHGIDPCTRDNIALVFIRIVAAITAGVVWVMAIDLAARGGI